MELVDQIFPDLPIRDFKSSEEPRLNRILHSMEEKTELVTIYEPDDIFLTEEMTTNGGHRYSKFALQQTCSTICPGLASVVMRLVRMGKSSFPMAANLFNRIAETSFSSIVTHNFLLKKSVIEGAVGPAFRYIPNSAVVRELRSALERIEHPTTFHSAQMAGRQLRVIYVLTKPITSKPAAYQAGYCVANSETGTASIKIVPAVVSKNFGFMAANWYKSRRCVHQGRNVNKRMREMLYGVVRKDLPRKLWRSQLRSSGSADPFSGVDRWSKIGETRLQGQLLSLDVPLEFAKTIVSELRDSEYPVRHDVFNAIGRASLQFIGRRRETFERAAAGWLARSATFNERNKT